MEHSPKIDLSRVKRILIEETGPGKNWSRRSLSIAAGKGPDLVRDIISGRSANPEMETLAGLATALGKDVSIFFRDGQQVPESVAEMVQVIGTVEAGVWRERSEWPESDRYWIGVQRSPVTGAQRFALVVEGYSMELKFPPGTIVDCIRAFDDRVMPESGDYVIVERRQGELRETSCKRLELRDDEQWELRCESSRPEFQEPIFIGAPDSDFATDDGVEIIGIVVGSYQPLFRR